MKKALALGLVLVFWAAIGFASGTGMEGTIAKLDMPGRSMIVQGKDGRVVTIYWNDATKVTGSLKQGAGVHVQMMEKGGKTWATFINASKGAKIAAQPK